MKVIELLHLEDDPNDQLLVRRAARRMQDLGYQINIHLAKEVPQAFLQYDVAAKAVRENGCMQDAPLILTDFNLPGPTNSLEFMAWLNHERMESGDPRAYATLYTANNFEEFPDDTKIAIRNFYRSAVQKDGSGGPLIAIKQIVRNYEDLYQTGNEGRKIEIPFDMSNFTYLLSRNLFIPQKLTASI